MTGLAGKVVVVTGGSRGIGASIVGDLLAQGARVASLALDEDPLRAKTPGLFHARCDVGDPSSVDAAVAAVLGEFRSVGALVNNAGVYPTTNWDRISPQEWGQVVGTNLTGTFLCTQAVCRALVDQGRGGSVVNIGSTASRVARPGTAHYAASKAGIEAMTRVLALELAPHGIRVNCVVPGLIATESARRHSAGKAGQAELRAKLARVPLGREGSARDVASMVMYLLSDAAAYVTGAAMVVDGGYSLGIASYAGREATP